MRPHFLIRVAPLALDASRPRPEVARHAHAVGVGRARAGRGVVDGALGLRADAGAVVARLAVDARQRPPPDVVPVVLARGALGGQGDAVDDVCLARVVGQVGGGAVALEGAEDEVGEVVAVEVPDGSGAAQQVVVVLAVDHEAVGAVERLLREVKLGGPPGEVAAPVDDVDLPLVPSVAHVLLPVGPLRRDDNVPEPVAVDVANVDRKARRVAPVPPDDLEAVGAGEGLGLEVDHRGPPGLAEQDVSLARLVLVVGSTVPPVRRDEEVRLAVAVDVPHRERPPHPVPRVLAVDRQPVEAIQLVHIEVNDSRPAARAKEHVDLARVSLVVGGAIRTDGTEDDVGLEVAIEVPNSDAEAKEVVPVGAIDRQAVPPGEDEGLEVHRGPEPARAPEDDVHLPRVPVGGRPVYPVAPHGAEDHVAGAVPVDVGNVDREPQAVPPVHPVHHEPIDAVQHRRREVHLGQEARRAAEQHPDLPRPLDHVGFGAVAKVSAKRQVVKAVSVDVTDGHGEAEAVVGVLPVHHEPVCPVQHERREVDRVGPAGGAPEEDVDLAGLGGGVVGAVGEEGADDHVPPPVAVQVPDVHRVAEAVMGVLAVDHEPRGVPVEGGGREVEHPVGLEKLPARFGCRG
mmetsp:Transcript_23975/g.60182  ORF Transcript_23975/g.60182 Transcript_23975/m.60182 type:complete len:627 (+) Transcript_23975:2233-4113(+)